MTGVWDGTVEAVTRYSEGRDLCGLVAGDFPDWKTRGVLFSNSCDAKSGFSFK